MDKIKRYKNVVERFLSGENGQRFFNIAYSIGAAIVILGALFKILHLIAVLFSRCYFLPYSSPFLQCSYTFLLPPVN